MTDREVYEQVLQRTGTQPDNHGEVHIDCPMCGKEAKRQQQHFSFRYDTGQDVAGGYCFVCGQGAGIRQIAQHYGIDTGSASQWTDEERRLWRIEAEQRRQAKRQDDLERRLSALEQMHKCQDHVRYHRQMNQEQRQYWYTAGIFDESIDRFLLGYCEQCPACHSSPSHTIPVFGYEGELVNIRHRLIQEVGGRYRPHTAGLGTQLFGADVLRQPLERVLILEGEKKAIVYQQSHIPAVGLMGKSFSWRRDWFKWFRDVGDIVIGLDPDATEQAWRLGELFAREGFKNVRVADFATKPDDAITLYGAKLADIEAVIRTARPVWTRK